MSVANKKLVVISQFFWPLENATGQLVTDLVDGLASSPIPVSKILTSSTGASYKYPATVFNFPLTGSTIGILSKLFGGVFFLIATSIYLIFRAPRNSIYLVLSNPPFAFLLLFLIKLLRLGKSVFIYQDIFPASAQLSGILPSTGIGISLIKALTSTLLNCCTELVVLSDDMKHYILSNLTRINRPITVIPNWSIESIHNTTYRVDDYRTKWSHGKQLLIHYSGNIGRLHDAITILESARLTQQHPIQYVFVGKGSKLNQIKEYKRYFNLDNITISEHIPRDHFASSLKAIDLSIVSLIDGSESVVAPSKLYSLLSNGIPVIYIGNSNSETARLLESYEAGKCIPLGDPAKLASFLHDVLKSPEILDQLSFGARTLYSEKFGFKQSLASYLEIFLRLSYNR